MITSSPNSSIVKQDLDQIISVVGSRWQAMRGKRLLLTGGTGFIGKWLLRSFIQANRTFVLSAEIAVISRDPSSFLSANPDIRNASEVSWIQTDVRELTPDAAGKFNFAIHAATDVSSNTKPIEIFETCTIGTQRVLDVLGHDNSLCRLLLLSSGAVYGQHPVDVGNFSESWIGGPDPLLPSSAYGEGKRASEMLCCIAAQDRPSLQVSIARCFAFVGPYLPLDQKFAIGNFIRAALSGEDFYIEGDGTPLRSYLYTTDLIAWLWIMLFDAPNARAYNIGGRESLSIEELARRVKMILGGVGEIKVAKSARVTGPSHFYVPAIDRIVNELGLEPKVNLDEAIRRTARWAKSHL